MNFFLFSRISKQLTMNDTEVSNSSCEMHFILSETNLVMILTAMENTIALTVLFTVTTKSNFNTHFLIRLLALNDLASALMIITSSLILMATCDRFAETLACKFLGWITMAFYCWSLHIVCIMNVERYFMVCHAVTHHNHFSKKLIILVMLLGLAFTLSILGLPLVGVGSPYVLYDDNRLCAFDLAPKGNTQQKFLIGYASFQGIFWVALTAYSNIAMSRKLKQSVLNVTANRATTDNKSTKQRQRFSLVTKVVAIVNCVMNLPFYVSIRLFKNPFCCCNSCNFSLKANTVFC